MRCIEIVMLFFDYLKSLKINRNMRCIEINTDKIVGSINQRLIETWDVLKCQNSM